MVPLYGGKPIVAFYFSTSGGHTENIENVWDTSPVPYLKGVVDTYDYYSPLHIWPENPMHWSAAKVAGDLGIYSASHPAGVKGILRSIYVAKRGVSPRVVKAAIIGDKGITWVSGTTLRFALDLRDTWVHFTTMSISPAAAQHKTISAGDKVTLSGRIYPALAEGAKVTLYYKSGSAWHTADVGTHRASQSLGSGKKAYYSTYALTVAPTATTKYYFSHGDAQSPHTVVTVKQAVKLSGAGEPVQAGSSVDFTGTVAPPTSRRQGVAADQERQPSGPTRPRASRTSRAPSPSPGRPSPASPRCAPACRPRPSSRPASAPLWRSPSSPAPDRTRAPKRRDPGCSRWPGRWAAFAASPADRSPRPEESPPASGGG